MPTPAITFRTQEGDEVFITALTATDLRHLEPFAARVSLLHLIGPSWDPLDTPRVAAALRHLRGIELSGKVKGRAFAVASLLSCVVGDDIYHHGHILGDLKGGLDHDFFRLVPEILPKQGFGRGQVEPSEYERTTLVDVAKRFERSISATGNSLASKGEVEPFLCTYEGDPSAFGFDGTEYFSRDFNDFREYYDWREKALRIPDDELIRRRDGVLARAMSARFADAESVP